MAGDQHHRSKKTRYDVLLVPRDDAGSAKSVRFAPWQVYLLVAGSLFLVVAAVIALLVYTPVGTLIPIENPGLVNRYSKELVALNQRMTSMMEQLLELREYNVKLRKALGEKVVATDSGVAVVGTPRSEKPDVNNKGIGEPKATEVSRGEIARAMLGSTSAQQVGQEVTRIVFPVVLPIEGYVTRGFEPALRHYGLDIAGSTGSTVHASADGYVVFAGWTSDDGNKIIISHVGGFLTFYNHNQSLLIVANTYVRRGQPIALLGSTGETSLGPHVHFEIWKDGVPVNPANYILNLNF
jgi:murein DD-endopeptidase MepM/ murein hydrolase activator NlpD